MSGNSVFRIENGLLVEGDTGVNTNIYTLSTFHANVTVNADLMFVTGNLTVGGNLNYTNTSISGSLTPTVDQLPLGNTTNRFDGYFYDMYIYHTLMPSTASSIMLGNSTFRWVTYAQNVDANGLVTIAGNVTVNSTAFVVDATDLKVGVNTATLSNTFTVSGTVGISGITTVIANVVAGGVFAGNTALFANLKSVTTGTQTIIDSFPKTQCRTMRYVISVEQATSNDVHSIEILACHDTTNLLMTKYGEIFTTSLGTFDGAINNANVEIYFTAAVANTYNAKVTRIQTN